MRTDLTELLMILDMSGSMYSLRDDTIGGYYDAEHNKYPEREEGVILINGKPYKPPKNEFGF